MPGVAVAAPPKKKTGGKTQPEVKFDEGDDDDPFA